MEDVSVFLSSFTNGERRRWTDEMAEAQVNNRANKEEEEEKLAQQRSLDSTGRREERGKGERI